jgi:hypothetical protein
VSLKTRFRVLVRGVRAGVVAFRSEIGVSAYATRPHITKRCAHMNAGGCTGKRRPVRLTAGVAVTPANSADPLAVDLESALKNLGYKRADLAARVRVGMAAGGNFDTRFRAALRGEA